MARASTAPGGWLCASGFAAPSISSFRPPALDDCIILPTSAVHSFVLEDVKGFLTSAGVRRLLTQALLDIPLFSTHWRWNATTALAVRRYRGGNKISPQLQRSAAEDLVALIFPDQLACLESLQSEREIPDHPLVTQTPADCLTAVMDVAGLERLLARIESGAVEVIFRDLAALSPLAEEVINACPYAFLDGSLPRSSAPWPFEPKV